MADSFDYIVVGAGSAGAVVATRLSEDPDNRVLVLEAGGPDRHLLMRLGIGFYRGTPAHMSWGFKTEPEPHLGGRQIDLPQGRALGGSSAINGKVYHRGHAHDYDQWRQMGCEGWSYADILPYFKRSEGNWRGETAYHGGSGPLAVTPIDLRPLMPGPVLEAAMKLGYPLSDDLNGAAWEGFANNDTTIRRGRRHSTARAFLRPAMKRPNLRIEMHAQTARLLVRHGRAVGVEYFQHGQRKTVHAEREIVLSGGCYNSPKTLLLSGIGPADELRALGIAPVHDLPAVGRNISEHCSFYIEYKTREKITLLNELRFDRAAWHFARWAVAGSGLFANQATTAQALIRTQPGLDRPDIQMFFNPLRMDAHAWLPGTKGELEHRINAIIVLLHPQSRGWVGLRSADPADPPRIQLNLLAERADVEGLIRGMRKARELYATSPLAELVGEEVNPGPGAVSDADLEAYARRTCGTARHPVGSCTMGHGPGTVVDPELRVHGIDGLRVADASVMPTVPGGNTNAPAIMIGEKAADLIRGRRLAPADI